MIQFHNPLQGYAYGDLKVLLLLLFVFLAQVTLELFSLLLPSPKCWGTSMSC